MPAEVMPGEVVCRKAEAVLKGPVTMESRKGLMKGSSCCVRD